jgi:hypothetical protein
MLDLTWLDWVGQRLPKESQQARIMSSCPREID